MSKILLSLATCLCLLKAQSQNGYTIHLHLKPYTSGKVYLGFYLGKIKALADSAQLNSNSDGVFSGTSKLPGGVYFIVSPSRAILFELLIDSEQHFSVAADTTNLPGSVVFTGSHDNTVFQGYTRYTADKGREIGTAQTALAAARKAGDSAGIRTNREKVKQLNDAIQQYRQELSQKYPNSLLTTLFNALKEPDIPPASRQPGENMTVCSPFAFSRHIIGMDSRSMMKDWPELRSSSPGLTNTSGIWYRPRPILLKRRPTGCCWKRGSASRCSNT